MRWDSRSVDAEAGPNGRYAISGQGRARQGDLIAGALAFEREQLKHLPPADVKATRRVLRSLLQNAQSANPVK